MSGAPLSRASRPAPPVRHVHLGLGNFFRAHQAWYTAHAPDAVHWGIAAFTGRSPAAAELLQAQDGLYTLVTRGPDGDSLEVVDSVVQAHPGSDHAAFQAYLADPAVAVVTLTVTEAGYRVADDDRDLTTSAVGRLVGGLAARRAAGAGPLAVVPCDNLPANGASLRQTLTAFAERVDPELAGWIDTHVAFVDTVVDRITPRLPDADLQAAVADSGHADRAPVVTEPFSEWVLAGEFPAGRPTWEDAGSTFTDDVTAFEHRKLWLLNGGHSLLAYAGSIRGHATVAEAVADPFLRDRVASWWDEATPGLGQPAADVAAYRQALLERWRNPRIAHALGQIATDGSQKLPVRLGPTLVAERRAGRLPVGAVTTAGAWLAHLRGGGAPVVDVQADEVVALARGPLTEAAGRVVGHVAPPLAGDAPLAAAVADAAREFGAS